MFNVQNPENPESSILETKNKTLSLDFPLPIILNHYNEVILVYVVFFPGTPQHVDGGDAPSQRHAQQGPHVLSWAPCGGWATGREGHLPHLEEMPDAKRTSNNHRKN